MKKLLVFLKALPGNKVIALNYNKKPADWEHGTVLDASAGFDKDGVGHMQYRVMLDRKSAKGNHLFITVGNDGIDLVKITKITEKNRSHAAMMDMDAQFSDEGSIGNNQFPNKPIRNDGTR